MFASYRYFLYLTDTFYCWTWIPSVYDNVLTYFQGIEFLLHHDLVKKTPEDVAQFLYKVKPYYSSPPGWLSKISDIFIIIAIHLYGPRGWYTVSGNGALFFLNKI